MVKPSDLVGRPDFTVGPLTVSPGRRRVAGPGGEALLEPLIMQVFLLLLDGRGQVVTRDELFDACWGGAIVGDDSLNRAINRVRRTGAQVAPGLFEIETIPRTGYRLTGDILDSPVAASAGSDEDSSPGLSRRAVVGSATALGLVAAGGIGLSYVRSREERRFEALVERGEQALLFDEKEARRLLQSAVERRPGDGRAQGLLAYAHSLVAEYGEPEETGAAAMAAEHAARLSLSIDPRDPYARLTQTALQRTRLDVATNEDRLRDILASHPGNIGVMRHLWNLYQSVGLSRRAAALNERAFTLAPLTPGTNYPKAQLLWIFGRYAEADRVIDRAMHLWPSHPWVRYARFIIYAFTDRPRAAAAMLDSDKTRPQSFEPDAVALWRVSLDALDRRTPDSVEAATRAHMAAARQRPASSSRAILTLAALGKVDQAFDVANDLFLFRDPVASRATTAPAQPAARSTAWRFTPWLFTPPVAPLRADPRFATLCEGIGLTEYWTKRGVRPDYQLGIT